MTVISVEQVSQSPLQHDKEINISTGAGRQTKLWKNTAIKISEFIKKISTTTRTQETYEEFLALSKADQDGIKDVGAFVGGSLKGGSRRKSDVANRHIITLDMDYAKR